MKGQSSELHSAAAATSSTPSSTVVSSSSFGVSVDKSTGSTSAIVQLIQTSKRKIWNEIEVEEIEEEEDEEDDEDDDHRGKSDLEEHIVVIGDQSLLVNNHPERTLAKIESSDSFVQCQSHSQHNLQLQRVQLKRKSYSSMMSSKVMQRTISSSSSNSYFGTVDEESDDDDKTAKMNSSADSVQEERTEQEVREERREEELQDFRSQQRSARRAYSRSISFSGVRSYHGGNRYLQQQASLARRGLIFQRLDGRTLLPSISCE